MAVGQAAAGGISWTMLLLLLIPLNWLLGVGGPWGWQHGALCTGYRQACWRGISSCCVRTMQNPLAGHPQSAGGNDASSYLTLFTLQRLRYIAPIRLQLQQFAARNPSRLKSCPGATRCRWRPHLFFAWMHNASSWAGKWPTANSWNLCLRFGHQRVPLCEICRCTSNFDCFKYF